MSVLERRLTLETDEAEVLILVRYEHFSLFLAVLELMLETDEAEVFILIMYGHFSLCLSVLERKLALETDEAEVLILVRYGHLNLYLAVLERRLALSPMRLKFSFSSGMDISVSTGICSFGTKAGP